MATSLRELLYKLVARGGLRVPTGATTGFFLKSSNSSGDAEWSEVETNWKLPVAYCTTEVLNGEAHLSGENLLSTKEEKVKVDGGEPVAGDRILIALPGNTADGIWEVIKAGKTGEKWELARTADCNTTKDLQNATVCVEKGTRYLGTTWTQIGRIEVINTTVQSWRQIGQPQANCEVFTTTEEWKKRFTTGTYTVTCIGGGGGGAGGGHNKNGTTCGAGAGGGGGGVSTFTFQAEQAPSSGTVTVGKGGKGGKGTTTEVANGEAGEGGTSSSFLSLVTAEGGSGGTAGKSAATAAGGAGGFGIIVGNAGGKSEAGFSGEVVPETAPGPGGGGPGGGAGTTEGTFGKGASGGASLLLGASPEPGAGATLQGEAGKNGKVTAANKSLGLPGCGGGGGASGFKVAGGKGGEGSEEGGGGGGGGACTSVGLTSGEGGKGGAGVVVVTWSS